MTLCTSSDFLLFLLFAFVIWTLNSSLISSGLFQLFYRQYMRRLGLHDEHENVGASEERLSRWNHDQHSGHRTEERLARTYAVIYGPTETYIEAEETRTWLWLCVALLINVVCIRIELMLFENLMVEDADNGTMVNVHDNNHNGTDTHGHDFHHHWNAANRYSNESFHPTRGVRGGG